MKMKKSAWLGVVLFLLAAMILPAAVVGAKGAATVEFAGKEYLVALLVPGDLSEPGGNFHGRNREWLALEEADNSCVTGESLVTSNMNINKHGKEHAWGKWVIEPVGYEGTWETTWRSQGDYIYAAGHGTGVFRGMTIKFTFYGGGVDENGDEYMSYTGSIHVPPNAQVQCES